MVNGVLKSALLIYAISLFGVSIGCGGTPGLVETASAYSKSVHKKLRRNIDDKERRAALRALQDRVVRAEIEAALAGIAAADRIRNKPNITAEETDTILAECAAERKKSFTEIGTVRMEMRQMVSPEEWDAVFGAEDEETEDDTVEDGETDAE